MNPIRRNIYRRLHADSLKTGVADGYLVERFNSKIVGKITPLGNIPLREDDLEAVLDELDITPSGDWQDTQRTGLHKVRCLLGRNYGVK